VRKAGMIKTRSPKLMIWEHREKIEDGWRIIRRGVIDVRPRGMEMILANLKLVLEYFLLFIMFDKS
jgi:hypothetical protein